MNFNSSCEWELKAVRKISQKGIWSSSCGSAFEAKTKLKDSDFTFCPYCGKLIEEKRPEKEVEG
jgi:rRNA maturation endonuclease Nob1